MPTISVRRDITSNKAALIRRALERYTKDEAVQAVIQAQQEAHKGHVIYGNLHEILKNRVKINSKKTPTKP